MRSESTSHNTASRNESEEQDQRPWVTRDNKAGHWQAPKVGPQPPCSTLPVVLPPHMPPPPSNCIPVITTACVWVSEHRTPSHLTLVINIIYMCVFSSLKIVPSASSLENDLFSRSQLSHVLCMKLFPDVLQGPRAPSPLWHGTRMAFPYYPGSWLSPHPRV